MVVRTRMILPRGHVCLQHHVGLGACEEALHDTVELRAHRVDVRAAVVQVALREGHRVGAHRGGLLIPCHLTRHVARAQLRLVVRSHELVRESHQPHFVVCISSV